MNYQKIYDDLIAKRIANPLSDNDKGHRHHIKPKRLFPDLATDPNNIVKLTYREHFIAHLLYAKICQQKFGVESWQYRAMHFVIYRMCFSKKFQFKINGRTYQQILEQQSKIKVPDEQRQRVSLKLRGRIPKNKGKKMSVEFSANISKRLKGNTIGKGRIHVTNGKINKMVFPNEIPKGFIPGRIYIRKAPSKKGSIPWNKGKKLRSLTEQEKQIRSRNANGRKHFTNGIKNIFVRPENVPEGFYPGITIKHK